MTHVPKRGRPLSEVRETVRSRRLSPIRVNPEEEKALREGAISDRQSLADWLRDLGLKRRAAQLKKG